LLSAPLGWHMLYHAALFETDHNRVPQRIEPAENDALYALRALRSCVPSEAAAV